MPLKPFDIDLIFSLHISGKTPLSCNYFADHFLLHSFLWFIVRLRKENCVNMLQYAWIERKLFSPLLSWRKKVFHIFVWVKDYCWKGLQKFLSFSSKGVRLIQKFIYWEHFLPIQTLFFSWRTSDEYWKFQQCKLIIEMWRNMQLLELLFI